MCGTCVGAPSCALVSCVVPQPTFLETGSLVALEVPGGLG